MLALLCAAAVAPFQVPVGQPPRLRTVLPNGAVILVERVPGAKSLAVDLFAGARSGSESSETNGFRHLLEHIVALGADGKLDQRLEAGGGFLRARTLRDAITFEFSLPTTGLSLGLTAVKEILRAPTPTAESIRREAAIIEQEGVLRGSENLASGVAWRRVYGAGGADPFGDLSRISVATPAALEAIQKRAFAGPSLVLSIVGDVDLDAATAAAAEVLKEAANATKPGATVRTPSPSEIDDHVDGAYRAIPVRGWRDPGTAAALAAVLALSSELDNPTVVYTPSGAPGLILVGSVQGGANLESALSRSKPAELFERGRYLAKNWIARRLAEPSGIAFLRGILMVEGVDLRPEIVLENLDSMKYSAFAAAFESLRASSAIEIGGRE